MDLPFIALLVAFLNSNEPLASFPSVSLFLLPPSPFSAIHLLITEK